MSALLRYQSHAVISAAMTFQSCCSKQVEISCHSQVERSEPDLKILFINGSNPKQPVRKWWMSEWMSEEADVKGRVQDLYHMCSVYVEFQTLFKLEGWNSTCLWQFSLRFLDFQHTCWIITFTLVKILFCLSVFSAACTTWSLMKLKGK